MPNVIDLQATRLNRRRMVGGLGAALSLGSMAPKPAHAEESAPHIYFVPGLPRTLPEDAGAYPRFVYDFDHVLNLDHVPDYRLARLKALFSASGEKTYLTHITRHFLCAPGKRPVAFLAEVALVSNFLERRDTGKAIATSHSLMTRQLLDPFTFQPLTQTKNPVTGEDIALPVTMFAISGEISMASDAPPEPRLQIEEPYYRFGNQVHLVMLDVRAGEGAHQPRLDSYLYKVDENDLRSPLVKTVDAELSYGALMRASVFRWMKFAKDDPTQVFSLRAGFKTNDRGKIPDLVKDTILKRFPGRI